jgi:hypothetical protein
MDLLSGNPSPALQSAVAADLTAGRLLTVEQAAAAMRVPAGTVTRALASGALVGAASLDQSLVATSSVSAFLLGRAAALDPAPLASPPTVS